MKPVIYIFIFIFICSCVKTSRNESVSISNDRIITDTTFVNNTLLELVNKNGKTELLINSKKYKKVGQLKISTPAYFLKRNNKVLSFSYPDVNVDYTIIIQGNHGIQGILFKGDSIIIGKYYTLSSLYNVQQGADEKVYWDFAHDN